MYNSPAVFQRFINEIFREHIKKGEVLTYMDDLVIMAKDEDEAMNRLRSILEKAEAYGLKIKWKKCQFMTRDK